MKQATVNCVGRNFDHFRVTDASGYARWKFEKCSFKYARFDDVYFRDSVFVECDFTGSKFRECNFRGARFDRCVFKYASFRDTVLDVEAILRCLPSEPNLKRDLCRSLRMNFDAIGDSDASRQVHLRELEATDAHLKKIIDSDEAYYSKKYPDWFARFVHGRIPRLREALLKFVWGHGESLGRLLGSGLLSVIVLSVVTSLYLGEFNPSWVGTTSGVERLAVSAYFVVLSGLGNSFELEPASTATRLIAVVCTTVGYLYFALFVVVLSRRLASR
jgi:hypothetical protein